jgi:glycosyltransferase involved in cell wall biosynthesis
VNIYNTELPLVSIITPSFNQGAFLEETIQSVFKQDYPNIEYIIIDGGSTDNTLEIIKKHQDKLSYFISEPDNGQTEAIIKGFNKAQGKYITWLCSDDIIEPSMVRISVLFLEKYPELAMTFGDRVRYDAKSNIIGYHRYCKFRPWLLKWGFAIPQETCLVRKSKYDICGELNSKLQMAMDFDLFCKLSKTGNFLHIPAFFGRFRSHTNNKSTVFDDQIRSSGFNNGKPKELAEVYKSHFNKNFPVKKWKIIGYVIGLLGFIDRRTKNFKNLRKEVRIYLYNE